MLTEVYNMRDVDAFVRVAAQLTNTSYREALWDDICDLNIVCGSEDLLDSFTLRRYQAGIIKGVFPEELLADAEAAYGLEDKARVVLQRMQLLGYCNKGIKAAMDQMVQDWVV